MNLEKTVMDSEFKNQEEKLKLLLDRITIENDLQEQIEKKLNKLGMYFHIFARVKRSHSLYEKLVRKEKKYKEKDEKLQDLIGIRIVLYYIDDIPICQKIIESVFHVRKEDSAVDKPKKDEFKPVRLNLICDIPGGEEDYLKRIPMELWRDYRIDKTFEVQIRTIFSEGWYEVDHDIRYKHTTEWEHPTYYDFNRKLNGINATLEICDNTIVSIIDSLAYRCYKENKIIEMFRYKLRIRMESEQIDPRLQMLLEENKELLKKFYRLDREKILEILSSPIFAGIPLTLNNIIYVCNALQIKDESINRILPSIIKCRIGQQKEHEIE